MPGLKCSVPNMTCRVVDGGRIQLLDCIGRGSFGAVYRARDLTGQTPSLLAVKIVSKNSKLLSYWREVSATHRVQRHPNIVTMHHWFHDDDYIYLVMTYCAGGDMWRAIRDRKIFFNNDALVKKIFLQVIDGVKWCHRRGVYHRDLKPSNILISPDCTKIWISDFGLATGTIKNFNFGIGTQNYRSPECNNFSGESVPFDAIRNDIWSLGVILINMLTGTMPWTVASKEDGWYMAFAQDRGFLRYTLPISEETDYILQSIFTDNPDDSIGLDDLRKLVEGIEHFWMNDADVAAAEPHLQRILSACRRQCPLSLPATKWNPDSHHVSSAPANPAELPGSVLVVPDLTSSQAGHYIRCFESEPEDEEVDWAPIVRAPANTSAVKPAASSSATSTHVGSEEARGGLRAGVKGTDRARWSLRRQFRRLFDLRAPSV